MIKIKNTNFQTPYQFLFHFAFFLHQPIIQIVNQIDLFIIFLKLDSRNQQMD